MYYRKRQTSKLKNMKRFVLFIFVLMSCIETFAQLPNEIADKAVELMNNQKYDNV